MATRRLRRTTTAPTTSFGEYFRMGFGVGLGSGVAFMILILVALAFFIPGFIMVKRQLKIEKKEDRSTSKLVAGFVLMGIGMVVGLGFGAGTFFSELGTVVTE